MVRGLPLLALAALLALALALLLVLLGLGLGAAAAELGDELVLLPFGQRGVVADRCLLEAHGDRLLRALAALLLAALVAGKRLELALLVGLLVAALLAAAGEARVELLAGTVESVQLVEELGELIVHRPEPLVGCREVLLEVADLAGDLADLAVPGALGLEPVALLLELLDPILDLGDLRLGPLLLIELGVDLVPEGRDLGVELDQALGPVLGVAAVLVLDAPPDLGGTVGHMGLGMTIHDFLPVHGH